MLALERRAVDAGAVRAAEVADPPHAIALRDRRMADGDARVIGRVEPHLARWVPSDEQVWLVEEEQVTGPRSPLDVQLEGHR